MGGGSWFIIVSTGFMQDNETKELVNSLKLNAYMVPSISETVSGLMKVLSRRANQHTAQTES